MMIERQPVTFLENKLTMLDYEKEALQSINSSMLSLKDTIKNFKDGLLLQNKASSSDENVLTASANAGAAQGTYDVVVLQKAATHRVSSDAQAGAYAGPTGTFDITIAGETFTVNVTTGFTMSQISQAINGSVSGGAVAFNDLGQASVITDPLSGNSTLVIESKETGTTNAITFNDVPDDILTSLGVLDAGDAIKNELQAAANAQLTINGVLINSSSNTISDAVFGVTMTIQPYPGGLGPATVTVGLDTEEIISQVKEFVDQFNTTTDLLANYIKEDTSDSDPSKGILKGDYDLISAKSSIRMKTTGYVDGSLSVYKLLSLIGIESEGAVGSSVSDNITVDEDKLRAALEDDKEEVADLLEGFADQLNTYLESQTKVTMVDTMAGNFYRRILGIDDSKNNIDDDIANWEDRLEVIEERYRNQFATMETYLSQLQSQSNYLTQQLSNLTKSSKD